MNEDRFGPALTPWGAVIAVIFLLWPRPWRERRRQPSGGYLGNQPPWPEVAPLFAVDTSGLDWLIADIERIEAHASAPRRRDPRTGRWER